MRLVSGIASSRPEKHDGLTVLLAEDFPHVFSLFQHPREGVKRIVFEFAVFPSQSAYGDGLLTLEHSRTEAIDLKF